MSRSRTATAALVLVAACGSAWPAAASESTEAPTPTSLPELERRVREILADRSIPGAGIALVDRDAVLWTAGVGLADVERGRPATDSTLFRVGSVAKSFLGLAFEKLVESGGVDLDTPVHEIAPEIAIDNPWAATDPVRIVHLLEHTAGFDDLHFNELYVPDGVARSLAEGLAVNPASRRVRFRPGTLRSYSSPGYAVAGYVLEKRTGMPYERYLARELLRPIGMTRSAAGILVDPGDPDLARGYQGTPPRPVPRYATYLRPAGDLDATAADMARFLRFLLRRGRVGDDVVLSPAAIERAERAATGDDLRAGLEAGYGLGIGRRYQDGFRWFGHNGAIDGFVAGYWYEPDAGLGLAVMINRGDRAGFAGLREIRDLLWGFLARDLWPDPPPPPAAMTAADLEALRGSYALVTQRMELVAPLNSMLAAVELTVVDGTLVKHELGEDPKPLIPITPTTFRGPDETEATFAFRASDGGGMTLFTRHDTYRRVSPWLTPCHRGFVLGSLLLIASAVVYGLIRLPVLGIRRWRGGRVSGATLAQTLLPLLAAVALFGACWALSGLTLFDLGQQSPATIAFSVGTLLFGLLSAVSLVTVLATARRTPGRLARAYAVTVSVASVGFAIYLAYWGYLGLRLWTY